MKAIDTLRIGLVLGLTLTFGAGSAARAQDEPKKEPAKKQVAKEKDADKSAGEKLWIVDFDEAKTIAAKEGKAILMEFTGSDWCPPCIALKEKVFDSDVFQTEAPKHLVLLKLDSPRDKSKQTDKEIEQYQTLSKLHKVSGVPTVILADATGKPFAKKVGYGGDEAKDYTKWLVEKAGLPKKRDSFLAQAKSAQGVERAKLLGQAISGFDSATVLELHGDIVEEIIKLDADNQAGLKAKYEDLLRLPEVKKELSALQEAADDSAELVKKIDEFIKDKKLAGQGLQEALWLKGQNQFGPDAAAREACKKTLEESIAAAPDTDLAKQISATIKRVFKAKEETDKKDEPKK